MLLNIIIVVAIRSIVADRMTAGIIAGCLLGVCNMFIICGSHAATSMNEGEQDDDENISCFSAKGYLFLFPKKGAIESVWCIIVTFLYGALMTYMLHSRTFFVFEMTEIENGALVYCLIFIGLAGYSLFS